jgi:hypothetical protein
MWFRDWETFEKVDSGGQQLWSPAMKYFDPQSPDAMQPHIDKAMKNFKGKDADNYAREVISKWQELGGREPSNEDIALGFAINQGKLGDKGTFVGLHPAVQDGLGSKLNSKKKDANIPTRQQPVGSPNGIRGVQAEDLPDTLKADGFLKEMNYPDVKRRVTSGKRFWERSPEDVFKEAARINNQQKDNPELAKEVNSGLAFADQNHRLAQIGKVNQGVDAHRQMHGDAMLQKKQGLGQKAPAQKSVDKSNMEL